MIRNLRTSNYDLRDRLTALRFGTSDTNPKLEIGDRDQMTEGYRVSRIELPVSGFGPERRRSRSDHPMLPPDVASPGAKGETCHG